MQQNLVLLHSDAKRRLDCKAQDAHLHSIQGTPSSDQASLQKLLCHTSVQAILQHLFESRDWSLNDLSSCNAIDHRLWQLEDPSRRCALCHSLRRVRQAMLALVTVHYHQCMMSGSTESFGQLKQCESSEIKFGMGEALCCRRDLEMIAWSNM